MKKTFLNPKASSRSSANKGLGVFANEIILRGETIAVWHGEELSREQLDKCCKEQKANSVQITSNLYLVPTELSAGDYVNHSCQPNAGLLGDRTLIALREIEIGEEITYDYAMTDSSDYDHFDCYCSSSSCRKHITGKDWTINKLQKRYNGYFSTYIKELIERSDYLS